MAPDISIAIVGAGPSGLTLASLFHKNRIPFTIFDVRPAPSPDFTSRPSGSLDLHVESGLLALESCGLTAAFEKLPGVCTEQTFIADKDGIIRYKDNGDSGTRPEIPRNSLTNLLLTSLPESTVKWEHKVISCVPEDGKYALTFQDRDPASFDLVIGADGAWSRVRPAITNIQPRFSGVSYISLTIPYLSQRFPRLDAMLGTGSYSAAGDGKLIATQRGMLDSAGIYLMLTSTEPTYIGDQGLDIRDMKALGEKLLNNSVFFADWAPELKELIRVACQEEHDPVCPASLQPLYMLPPEQRWEHVKGVTLVGDAAHLMTPFAGEGVNAAMLDALQLAQGIISAWGDEGKVDEAVRAYEDGMFPNAEKNMSKSWKNLKMMFAEDAPHSTVRFFESHGPPPEE